MKKLFTLIALLTCFLGAKAVEVVDVDIDFSKVSQITYYGWGASESARARISLVDGCLHFHSDEATNPTWDCQFHPIGGVNAEVGVVYTLHYKIKGSVEKNVSMLGFGQTPYGQFPITTEWVEGTVEYECTDAAGGNLLMQCGDYVGDFDIARLTITHEEREQKPVQWENILVNGDAEGEYGEIPCVQSKIFDSDPEVAQTIFPSEIVSEGGNKVFVTHAKAVNPILTWDSDGEQWGTPHKAGDPMPDNAWQNQLWITLPRAMKDGEQYKISFKYKASKAVKSDTQGHRMPGDYLDGGQNGQISFTTEWQSYEAVKSATAGTQSIAFNLGSEVYTEDIDFFLDDVSFSLMKLDEGFFVASTNTKSGLVDYDFDNATQFVWNADQDAYEATVGTAGKQESWVDEVMISTARGNDKGFKAATLKVKRAVKNDPEDWNDYEEAGSYKIKLPVQGVWTILIDDANRQMNFVKVEGDPDKEPITIVPNPTVVVVKAVERDWLVADGEGKPQEAEIGEGQPWDNQFMIMANRELKSGEETILEFDYVAAKEATSNTQVGGSEPGAYVYWNCVGNVDFTTEEQHFVKEYKIPTGDNNVELTTKSITFNLAVMKEANEYTFKNIVWKLADDTETLINMEGDENFYVKTGAGTTPTIPSGIVNVVNKKVAPSVIYNLAGQRVADGYQGIVVKNGAKVVVK